EVGGSGSLGGDGARRAERRRGEIASNRRLLDQARERRPERVAAVGVDVEGGAAPDLVERGDVAENERAARERRLERCEPERLVARRRGEDRGARVCLCEPTRRKPTEELEVPRPRARTVRAADLAGDAPPP